MMADPRTTHHDLPLIDPAGNARPEGLSRINTSIEGLSNLIRVLSDEKASKAELQELIGLAPDALNSFAEVAARIEAGETVSDALLAALALKASQADLDALQTQVNNFATAPIGNVIMWTFPTLPPDYIELWGATALRSQYPELFNMAQSDGMLRPQASKEKSEWGDGDGSTTFSFPDTRDDYPEGWGGGQGLDPSRLLLGWKADAVKAHSHSAGSFAAGSYGHSAGSGYRSASTAGATVMGSSPVTGTSGTTGEPVNRVRSFAVTFAIKFK